VTAAGATGLGAKVALVERHLLGGDCLNAGCVPSKCLIRSSRALFDIQNAGQYGISVPKPPKVDFAAVMERMRRLRARISRHDSASRLRGLGVDVFLGEGRFSDMDKLEVAGKTIRFKKAVIATGTRAAKPLIEGLADAGYLTNENVFSLTKRPQRLAVIGGGPLGCEMAQAFCRLGSEVVLLHKHTHVLNREDSDAAEILQKKFTIEGMRLILECQPKRVLKTGKGKVIYYENRGREESVIVDEILVGAGRAPNVEGLDLELAKVEYDKRTGILVNDRLQSSNPDIYAAGDVCLKQRFTHTADASARIVIQNALFMGEKKLSALSIPWCTYTDPEIAHVGMYEREAREKGIAVDTFIKPLSEVDRAIVDGEEEGFVKVIVKKGTDKILGANIVARHAGEMISEVSLAMAGNLGLEDIANVIHPYPTQAEAIKHVADAYNRTRLTSFFKNLFAGWLAWRR
jgi:pyruvate/2-oxoglutarate dehydrogenase complex dihydrolipoamide dehydrogenase (E3) component